MKKRILFIVSNTSVIGPNNRATGNFLAEVAHPYQTFLNQGYTIDVASVLGGSAPLDEMFEKDEALNDAFLHGEGAMKLQSTQKLGSINVADYDAVFIPGGLAPMIDMPDSSAIQLAIASTFERDAVVGAVCHGPVSLLNVKLSNGEYLITNRNLTSFSNAEEENYAHADVPFLLETALSDRGARYTAAAPWQAHVIRDGNLVTGQNPASAKGVAEAMIAVLESASVELTTK